MKVKYIKTVIFEFDTENLKEFYEIEQEDTENLELCKELCDSLTIDDFIFDMKAKGGKESQIEKI